MAHGDKVFLITQDVPGDSEDACIIMAVVMSVSAAQDIHAIYTKEGVDVNIVTREVNIYEDPVTRLPVRYVDPDTARKAKKAAR